MSLCTCLFAYQQNDGVQKESDYINLSFQSQNSNTSDHQDTEHGPNLQEGKYVRQLVEGMPWDIYEDKSKRRFFFNRDTGELAWKPPRRDRP